MKFVKLLKYVEKSYGGTPSFLILMSDNKEYISNGCTFIENTQENRDYLVNKFDCSIHLDKLLNAKDASLEDVVDGRYMFWGCENLVVFEGDMPNLKNGRYMFWKCKNLVEFKGNISNLLNGHCMFNGCESLVEFKRDLPNLEDGDCMFYGCKSLRGIYAI